MKEARQKLEDAKQKGLDLSELSKAMKDLEAEEAEINKKADELKVKDKVLELFCKHKKHLFITIIWLNVINCLHFR